MERIRRDVFRTPWGWMGAVRSEEGLRGLVLPRQGREEVEMLLGRFGAAAPAGPWDELRRQVTEYLAGRRRSFRISLDVPPATAFAEEVRRVVASIPYGKTMTYGEVAASAGKPAAARAVGRIMNRNPVPLIIPCHRVLAAAGPGGFASGLEMKMRLLVLEGRGRVP
jgi:O-6-methylguanine DNA methyltransferase